MALIILCFTLLCMAVGGFFLVVKGSREHRVSLVIIGMISILIVLTLVYLAYRISSGPFAFG